MLKDYLKVNYILPVIASIVGAFSVGYSIGKMKTKKTYEEEIERKDQELERCHYQIQRQNDKIIELKNISDNIRMKNETFVSALKNDTDSSEDEIKRIIDTYGGDNYPKPKDLDIDDHPYDNDEDDHPLVKVMDDAAVDSIIKKSKPKLIKVEDFGEIFTYDTETLYLYRDDSILADENDDIIENEDELIGDCLDKFNFRDSNETSIYVRNDRLRTDYEILKVNGSYRDDVIGR
ncbi:MAG: hypothetical protein Q4C64_04085 [Erysipelotrichia bacterium]|nr:hypothetical protein [Erysipelotrichia bacterium]